MATETDKEIENDESLIALTTHFAQVQFRLKQIISAEPEYKESLLHDLEEFAFQGCKPMTYDTAASGEHTSTEAQRKMRTTLMEKLQDQLTEIERCAEEAAAEEERSKVTTEGGGASSMAEKQKIIIESLRKRFDLQFGDLDELSTEEVKESVEKAMNDVVDPIKSKEEYVAQLQSQIVDLERYISFLQDAHPNTRTPPPSPHTSGLPLPRSHDISSRIHVPRHKSHDSKARRNKKSSRSHDHGPKSHDISSKSHDPISQTDKPKVTFAESADDDVTTPTSPKDVIGPFLRHGDQPVPEYRLALTQLDEVKCRVESSRCEWGQESSLGEPLEGTKGADDLRLSLLVMRKTLAVMQVLTLCQCGGSFHCLPRTLKEMGHRNYQRALHSLEEAVDKTAVITAALNEPGISMDTRVSLETDLHEVVSMTMADSLRVLLEHGLLDEGRPLSFTGGCFPAWRGNAKKGGKKKLGEDCAAWRVFKHYYTVKNGRTFSNKTDQLLASSFSIPMATHTSMKKTLLVSIHRVDNTYQGCHHRAADTKFRALICEGFNVCHLAEWFRIMATQPSIGEDLYSVTSFLATTGFRPALGCLERLKDNPPGHTVELPRAYYKCPEAYQPKAM